MMTGEIKETEHKKGTIRRRGNNREGIKNQGDKLMEAK